MKKSVFITGGSDGTGLAISRRFAREGYDVFIGSRNGERAQTAAQSVAAEYGVFAKGYETKIFNEENVKAIFADIRSMGYLLSALVLNAANLGIGQKTLDVDIADFMNVYETNIGWNFLLSREAIRQMIEAGGGAIVFIASNSALRVTEDRCAYCSSKSAILAMSKSFAVDFGKYRIRSNCVLPGMIKTERWRDNLNGCKYALANFTPLRDIAAYEDVASAAYFLASEDAANITGTELVVDGGNLAQLVPNPNWKLWE